MFKIEELKGKRVLKSSLFEDTKIAAFFTTRDLSLKSGERQDLAEQVEQNKKFVCEVLNIPFENLIIPIQTHNDNIEIITSPFTLHPSLIQNTDALITNQKNIALALNFADCVPIIFYDSVEKVVAEAHAGWRGTAAKIAQKTINKMQEEFNCKPQNIICAIGPSIGKCCFEVGDDVREKLLETVDNSEKGLVYDKMNVNLKLINKFQILAMGVEKIDVCEDCTCCKTELFFSYRQEKGKTARHSAVIMLKG